MTSPTWSAAGYEAVVKILGARTGLSFAPNRYPQAEEGIRRAMQRAGVADLDRYGQLLRTSNVDLDDLVGELTVRETYFFRHPELFEAVREEVLPRLADARDPRSPLRVWSAGCAGGEEAYSLAILFEEEEMLRCTSILATDISQDALAQAHTATYTRRSLRGLDESRVDRYFQHTAEYFVLCDRVRKRVSFSYLNLALDCFPSFRTFTVGLDLIFCRNVLIYLDSETVASVSRRFFDALAPGGWLVTAPSDPPLQHLAPFEAVSTRAGIFYRRGIEKTEARHPPRRALCEPTRDAAAPLRPQPPRHNDSSPRASDARVIPDGGSKAQERLREAAAALAGGDRLRVVELLRDVKNEREASALYVRALANVDISRAEQACREAAAAHPFSVELHYLHVVLLQELGRLDEAAASARRTLYLDRGLAVAHLSLGSILARRGDLDGARRAYRNARRLCALQSLPFDALKIDRSFVGRLGSNPECAVIVRAVAAMAQNLGIAAIAEGVETAEQLEVLRSLGCEYAHGFLFAKPLERAAAEALIADERQW